MNKGLKKTKIISKGLSYAGYKPASDIAKTLGYGQSGGKGTKAGASKSPWLAHVKAYRASHPGMSYKDALSGASASYKSSSGAGLHRAGVRAKRKVKRKSKGQGLSLAGRP